MTATINLPLWSYAAIWIAICWLLDLTLTIQKRRERRRRLRALDRMWADDEVGVAPLARRARRDYLRGATPTFPWPRVTVYRRTGDPGDAA